MKETVRLSGMGVTLSSVAKKNTPPNEERVNVTCRTFNYDMFQRLEGNRQINMVHVKRLEESIKKNGMLQVDIIVNEKMQIIDGQNRLEAARSAQSPVYYKVCYGYGLREAQILNENVKQWRKVDYLDSYCELGVEEYIKFKEFMEYFEKHFKFGSCEALIRLGSTNKVELIASKKVSSDYFETGNLKILDINKSYDYGNKIVQIKPFFDAYNTSTFVRTMIFMLNHENYDHEEFLRKLKVKGSPMLTHCSTMEQYKLIIEDIFNYKRPNKVNLRY